MNLQSGHIIRDVVVYSVGTQARYNGLLYLVATSGSWTVRQFFDSTQAERRCMTTRSGRSFRAGEMAENALQEMLLKLIEDRQKRRLKTKELDEKKNACNASER